MRCPRADGYLIVRRQRLCRRNHRRQHRSRSRSHRRHHRSIVEEEGVNVIVVVVEVTVVDVVCRL